MGPISHDFDAAAITSLQWVNATSGNLILRSLKILEFKIFSLLAMN